MIERHFGARGRLPGMYDVDGEHRGCGDPLNILPAPSFLLLFQFVRATLVSFFSLSSFGSWLAHAGTLVVAGRVSRYLGDYLAAWLRGRKRKNTRERC